jgi:formate dehydrogenase gamma subunit
MSLFQSVTYTGLAVVVGVLVLHFLIFRPRRIKPAQETAPLARFTFWERIVHWGLAIGVLGLAGTALIGPLGIGPMLHGWLLMVHCGFGSLLAISLLLNALMWAEASAFAMSDCDWFRKGCGYVFARENIPAGRLDCSQKIMFWAMTAFGCLALGSATMLLLKFYGTEGQHFLLRVHKGSGLLLVFTMLVHVYLVLVAKPGGCRLLLSGKVSPEWAQCYHSLWWQELQEGEKK